MHGIDLQYSQDRQFLYAKINPFALRRALTEETVFEALFFEALEDFGYSSFSYQLDTEQLEDLSQLPWYMLSQTLVRRIAVRTEFTLDVEISPDKMLAKARLKRAFQDEKVSVEGLTERLAEFGVVAGLQTHVLQAWCDQPDAQSHTDQWDVVARGQESIAGIDGGMSPCVDSVWVQEGMLLARQHLATPGEPGFNVLGQPLPVTAGKEQALITDKYCLNQEKRIISRVAGCALLTPHLMLVSPVVRIALDGVQSGQLQSLCDLHESLYLVGDLRDCTLKVEGHLWIEGNAEQVDLRAGGHVAVLGDLRGPSVVQCGGSFFGQSVAETLCMVAQSLVGQHWRSTQAFVGQTYQGPEVPEEALFLHPATHPFFAQEQNRLSTQLRDLEQRNKACVQELIEARKAEQDDEIQRVLDLIQRLNRRQLFLRAALLAYADTFENPCKLDPHPPPDFFGDVR